MRWPNAQARGFDVLAALSLANLNLLQVWRELLYTSPSELYWIPSATPHDFRAAIIVMIILAAIIFACLQLIWRFPRRAADLAFLAFAGVLLINFFDLIRRAMFLHASVNAVLIVVVVFVALLALAASVTGRASRIVSRSVYVASIVLSAFALSNLAQAIWRLVDVAWASEISTPGTPPMEAAAPTRPPARVVWLIFDGLDERNLFTSRSPGYSFPAFDHFRDTSLHFTRVRPPGGATMRALPTLWLGRLVAESRPRGPAELEIRFEGEEHFQDLRGLSHVFTAARERGANVAVIGWYHPYCRLFVVQYCKSASHLTTSLYASHDFTDALIRVGNALHPLWRRLLHIETHRQIFSAAPVVSANRQFDFVAIHAPVPHPPYIFDARRGALSWLEVGLSYDDNIALADRYLAAIRDAMTQAGLWDETAVVISADHGDRGRRGDSRDMVGVLPLLVKLPGQHRGAAIDTDLNGEIQRDLILALIDGAQWYPGGPNR